MRFLICLYLFTLSACANAQQLVPDIRTTLKELEPTLDAIVREEMEETHLPGVALVVVHNGETIIKRGYGVADVESGRPVDTEATLFRIGSVSKALTGLALTRLIDQGKVGIGDPVSRYFDKINYVVGADAPVTIKHILTHTGGFDQIGLDRHIYAWDRPLADRKALRPSLEEFLGDNNLRVVSRPGQMFRYDTYGITLGGLVVEKATSLPFADAMRQELFAPLGMNNSFVEADDAHVEDLAIGHGWVNDEYVRQPYEIYVTTPASSIDATPADMARLLEALTGGGANANGRLFSKKTAEAVLSPQYRPHPRFTGITHNLWESPSVDPPDGPFTHSVGHGGSMLGFWTLLEVFTEANIGVFIATNRNWEAGGGGVYVGQRVNTAILDAIYKTRPKAPITESVPVGSRDLSAYTGDYASGIYCHSCTPGEFARGAWPREDPRSVTVTPEGLRIGDELFLPTSEDDVFVREDGKQEVFFGRDLQGAVSFYVNSFGPFTFERITD